MKKLLNKQEKFIKYCIFGVLISIIEILLYCILSKFINLEPLIANSIAFILSVLMSYYANSKYVFKTIFFNSESLCLSSGIVWMIPTINPIRQPIAVDTSAITSVVPAPFK